MKKLTPTALWQQACAKPAESESRDESRLEHFLLGLYLHGYVKVDTKGYYGNPEKGVLKEILECVIMHGASSLAHFFEAPDYLHLTEDQKTDNRRKMETWLKHPTKENFQALRPEGQTLGTYACWVSGKDIRWHFDGATFAAHCYWDRRQHTRVALEPFPYPDGKFPQAQYTIPVPSGKLALFQWIDDPELIKDLEIGKRPSSNSVAGRIAYSRYFEEHGFWHLFVGGCGRDLFQKGSQYLIGRKYDEDREKACWDGWQHVGELSFGSDLRWFTACDASRLTPKHFKMDKVLVISVPPGNYTLSDLLEREEAPDGFMATFEKANC